MISHVQDRLLSVQTMLDALPGVSYVVDPDGTIMMYNAAQWTSFARSNNSEHLTSPQAVLGHSLFSFIRTESIQDHYRLFHRNIIDKRTTRVEFHYRCDAPHIRRDMLMCISPIVDRGELFGILYQSITLAETMRPAMGIFRYGDRTEFDSWPIITVCSYCLRLRNTENAGTGIEWLSPESYYHLGGSEHVRLSHGICPDCHDDIVKPQFVLAKIRAMSSSDHASHA